MKAVVCGTLGPIEDLRIGELPMPQPGSNQVLVKVGIAAMNFPDQLIVKGQYQASPQLPFAPGFEVAGTVVSIGNGVSGIRPGERVAALTLGSHGGYAEFAVADADRVVAIPASMALEPAAAFYSSYGTAYHALVQRGQLKSGETIVVLGAGGGLGLAAIQIAKALGARVIAVAGSQAKLDAARQSGADACINHHVDDVKAQIGSLTAGKGADVCLDPVGGALFDIMSRQMAWNGRLLVLGFTSGIIPSLRANLPMLKCYQLVGVFWDSFSARFPEENRWNFEQLFAWLSEGRITPQIDSIFGFQEYAAALGRLVQGSATGRLLLRVDEDMA